jgi:NADH-quinone oxidoreductase subunit L
VIALMAVALLVSVAGILLGLAVYAWRVPALDPGMWARRLGGVYRMLSNKYYFDEIYNALVVRPSRALGTTLWRFDAQVVDGAVNGVAEGISDAGGSLRRAQTGFVGNYALAISLGLVALVGAVFLLR